MNLTISARWLYSILLLASCFIISEFFLYSLWGKISSSNSLSTVLNLWTISPLDQTAKYTEDWIKYQSSTFNSPYFLYALQYFNLTDFDPFSRQSGINIWDLFPPEYSCPDIQRIGNIGEGGKWVCGLSWLKKQKAQALRGSGADKCIIYSYGVSIETSFEQHMLTLPELKCQIFAFDPTVVKVNVQDDSGVVFHKQALWNTTGATDAFLLTEHLFDTMNRLNHSFIDILKVDIEGSEWPVFHELLQRARRIRNEKSRTGTPWSLPFGQLLIELHYEDTPSIVDFFSGMAEFGFNPFSREINLQPCLDGRLPFAVEYSFIHASFFDEMSRNPIVYPLPPVVNPTWSKRPKAVIYYLTQRKRLSMMGSALQSLYDSFYKQFPFYDVLIFHDDLSSADRAKMQSYVPNMPLNFIEIHLDVPKHLRPPFQSAPLPRVPHCAPNTSTIGYRHMIMFHSTWIHKYLFNPAHGFSDVEYILRLDDDSSFSTPIAYDMFKMMDENKLLYGFVSTLQDDPGCVRGLWNFTWNFLRNTSASSKYNIPEENLEYFRNHWYEGNVVYNNFELSHAKIWKTHLWIDFMTAVDKSGHVYSDRWGDAPLHTIYVLLALSISQIHAFSDLPYRHDPFVNRKGSGLPPPSAYPFEDGGVVCVYYAGWKCQGKNISNTTYVKYISGGPLTPSWGSNVIVQRFGWDNIAPPIFPTRPKRLIPLTLDRGVGAVYLPYKKRKGTESFGSGRASVVTIPQPSKYSDVLYTFGHVSKYMILSETINNFFTNYVQEFPCPIVVFHFSNFNTSLIHHMRAHLLLEGAANITKFILVDDPYICLNYRNASKGCHQYAYDSLPTHSCIPRDLETLGASRFLVKDALYVLHSMGYEWTFRIADRSILSAPIKYNLFESLRFQGKKYGFNSVIKDNPSCITNLWKKVAQFCTKTDTNCSTLFTEWDEGVIVFTNFEISHFSIWYSPIFLSLVSLPMSDENYPESLYWSDASLHTIAVTTFLTSKEIQRFEDIKYTLVPHLPSLPSINRPSMKTLPSIPLYHFNTYFHPQRFGWLGGDIGASFVLPPISCANSLRNIAKSICTEEITTSRSIWLFGDSLIGTSTPSSRIEAEFIPNSVGIVDFELNPNVTAPLGLRSIRRSKFYWGSSDDGVPGPLFTIKSEIVNKSSLEHKYWPYDGITIIVTDKQSSNSPANILVIGQVVTPLPSSILGMDLLSFSITHSLGYLISNPYESPDLWEYESLPLPRQIVHHQSSQIIAYLNWIAIADSNGRPFTSSDGSVYLLGSYDIGNPTNSQYDLYQVRKLEITQIIAKVSIHDLLQQNFQQYHILMNSANDPKAKSQWISIDSIERNPQSYRPRAILSGSIAEGSLHYNRVLNQWSITSLDVLEPNLRTCLSATQHIEAEWSCMHISGIEPKWKNDKKYLTYAGKSHPEFIQFSTSTLSFPSPAYNSSNATSTFTSSSNLQFSTIQLNPFHGVLSYVANPLHGPDELFNEFDRETYCPSFLLF